jgi:hypothetical protein
MKLRVTLAAMLASMAICSQGFGFDLLDRMLGGSGCGCASSCCATPVGPSCGADNGCGAGCGGMIGPSCGADNGCGGMGLGCGNGCRKKLLDFDVRCVSLPVIVPKINLPKIRLPKLNRGCGGCADPCGGNGCANMGPSCGADNGCGAGCGCGNAAPSCGADNGCGAGAGCGCGNVGPSCGADNGCGCGNAAPSCGADNGCGAAADCCAPACRVGLLDKIRSRMACRRAAFQACNNACGCATAAPSCGADNGCGCGNAAPSCGADNGCGAPAAMPAAAPVAAPAPEAAPVAPVVDPAAFKTRRGNNIIQASLSDR